VFATQPTLWKADLPAALDSLLFLGAKDPTRSPLGAGFYSTTALARGMAVFNAELIELCARLEMECVDLASQLPSDTTVFYDDLHFNESGARAVAAAMAPLLTQVLRRGGPPNPPE
jgi:lysophospholipase L1-like esterase